MGAASSTTTRQGRLAWLGPVALCVVSLVAAMGIAVQPRPDGPIAAVFPMWWSEADSFAAASTAGAPVRFGTLPFIVVVMPADDAAAERLQQAGAWLLLDPIALGGCAPERSV